MQFIVIKNFRPNIFGKPEGSSTIAGNSENSIISIEFLVNEVVHLKHLGKKRSQKFMCEEERIFHKKITSLKLNEAMKVLNYEGRIVALIRRVSDDYTLGNLIKYFSDF